MKKWKATLEIHKMKFNSPKENKTQRKSSGRMTAWRRTREYSTPQTASGKIRRVLLQKEVSHQTMSRRNHSHGSSSGHAGTKHKWFPLVLDGWYWERQKETAIKRKATRKIRGWTDVTYRERELFNLRKKQLMGDMIIAFHFTTCCYKKANQ